MTVCEQATFDEAAAWLADLAGGTPNGRFLIVGVTVHRTRDALLRVRHQLDDSMVVRESRANGNWGIELANGASIQARPACATAGRGRILDALWLDGPVSEEARLALMPCLSGRGGEMVTT